MSEIGSISEYLRINDNEIPVKSLTREEINRYSSAEIGLLRQDILNKSTISINGVEKYTKDVLMYNSDIEFLIRNNDSTQIKKLQIFLRSSVDANLQINGKYDKYTARAINAYRLGKVMSGNGDPRNARMDKQIKEVTDVIKGVTDVIKGVFTGTISPLSSEVIDRFKLSGSNGISKFDISKGIGFGDYFQKLPDRLKGILLQNPSVNDLLNGNEKHNNTIEYVNLTVEIFSKYNKLSGEFKRIVENSSVMSNFFSGDNYDSNRCSEYISNIIIFERLYSLILSKKPDMKKSILSNYYVQSVLKGDDIYMKNAIGLLGNIIKSTPDLRNIF